MLSKAKYLLALARHAGEVPNILAKGNAFLEADPIQPKNVALRGLSEAFDPIFNDLDVVRTQYDVSEEEAERTLIAALQAQGEVQAAGLLDRLKAVKDLYDLIQPILLILFPAPALPFETAE